MSISAIVSKFIASVSPEKDGKKIWKMSYTTKVDGKAEWHSEEIYIATQKDILKLLSGLDIDYVSLSTVEGPIRTLGE